MKRNSMYTKGDFHIHSTYSDGSLTPSQIINLAKEKRVDILSITDHNNTDGIEIAKNPQEVQKQVNSIRTEIKLLSYRE